MGLCEGRRVTVKEGAKVVLGAVLGPVGATDGAAVDGVAVGLVGEAVDGRTEGGAEGLVGPVVGNFDGFKLIVG